MTATLVAPRAFAAIALIGILLAGCGGAAGPTATPMTGISTAQPTAAPTTLPTAGAMPAPTSPQVVVDGKFSVASDGRALRMICLGAGSPTIVLEAGHPSSGINQFFSDGKAFTTLLAENRRVCMYSRAGYGSSDPAPAEPRDLDDVTHDLHALLAAAKIEGPLQLVGSSFGGMIVTYYANRFPDGIVGVVLLDVPAPSATLNLEEAPELAWDHPSNPEHVDVIPEFENRLAAEQFPFEAPLLVITATDGDSSVADQAFWLAWSKSSRQIEIEGGHAVYLDSPFEVADAILGVAR